MSTIRPTVNWFSSVILGIAGFAVDAAPTQQTVHPAGPLSPAPAAIGGMTAGKVTWPRIKASNVHERRGLRLHGEFGTASRGSCANGAEVKHRRGNHGQRLTSKLPPLAQLGVNLLVYCGLSTDESELATAALEPGAVPTPPTAGTTARSKKSSRDTG